VPYKCRNIYNPSQTIFLISDPPHLLKTACNNVRSSKMNGTKCLRVKEHHILWRHFCKVPQLYQSNELRCCKLTSAHFCNDSYAKMRVRYAAQLLSNSVANLMEARGGEEMKMSAWFARLMNRWFDLMNTNCCPGKNPDLNPYRSADDPRLIWLREEFIHQIEQWKENLIGTGLAKAKQFLSHQTYLGLKLTTMAIVELVQELLETSPNGSYVITKRLNQDPLEAFFGQIRQLGRRNEMPNIVEYAQNHTIISWQKGIRHQKGSNVHRSIDWRDGEISNEHLPKKKKL